LHAIIFIERIVDIMTMLYINLLFTYLLVMLPLPTFANMGSTGGPKCQTLYRIINRSHYVVLQSTNKIIIILFLS